MSIKEFHFWCQKVLPLVYDDSLSYYEVLCKTTEKLNEVINTVNSFGDDFYKYVDASIVAVDSKLSNQMKALQNNVNNQLDTLQKSIDKTINDIINQMNSVTQYVDSALKNQQLWVTNQLVNLRNEINTNIALLKEYIDSQNNLVYIYVDEQIQKVIDMIPKITSVIVTNPITGKQESIQVTLNYLTYVFKYYAFTALKFDREEMTASEFDAKEITAFEFDIFGYKIFHRDDRFYMRNPSNGNIEFYQNIIYWLISLHRDLTLTAEEFDSLLLSATTYDTKNITAYDYDFIGKQILGGI